MNGRVVGLTASPEFAVAVFAFLLNFPWEFLQTPLYVGMPALPHWEAIKICTRAALGDVAIMLLAFAVVALLIKDRHWIVRANVAHAACLSLAGLVVTTMIEWLAINDMWLGGWRYAPSMPRTPWLGVGLVPLLQWLVLPPLVVWLAKRHLRGSA
jgi:hypothetical protein